MLFRSGPWAAAWAVLHHLGDEGYLRVTAAARTACTELVGVIRSIPELRVVAEPDATLVAFAAVDPSMLSADAVADALWRRGWYVDRQGPPSSLHCTVNAVHEGRIGEFAAALADSVTEALGRRGERVAYGTVD